MELKIEFFDQADLEQLDRDHFRKELKQVFDASIPWDEPQYDASFQDHYFDHIKSAVFIRTTDDKPIALAVAFIETDPQKTIFYIAGIWVDCDYKSRGIGKLLIETLIDRGTSTCNRDNPLYISLRTQNAQLYEFFDRNYDLYPKWDKETPADIKAVALSVHQKFSPSKEYEPDNLIVRKVFPTGIVVGHLHFPKSKQIEHYIFDYLDVEGGDSYILVMNYDKPNQDPVTV